MAGALCYLLISGQLVQLIIDAYYIWHLKNLNVCTQMYVFGIS